MKIIKSVIKEAIRNENNTTIMALMTEFLTHAFLTKKLFVKLAKYCKKMK